MGDLRQELADFDGTYPPAWRPKPGDVLVGRILAYDRGQTPYGSVHTCILDGEDGQRYSLWLSSVVLLDLFRRHRPKVGERIGLKYLGKHAEKGYHRYVLRVDRDGSDADLAPLGGELDAEDVPPAHAPGSDTGRAAGHASRAVPPVPSVDDKAGPGREADGDLASALGLPGEQPAGRSPGGGGYAGEGEGVPF